jgi:hypothetical protein
MHGECMVERLSFRVTMLKNATTTFKMHQNCIKKIRYSKKLLFHIHNLIINISMLLNNFLDILWK